MGSKREGAWKRAVAVGSLMLLSACGHEGSSSSSNASARAGVIGGTGVTSSAASPGEMNVGDIYVAKFDAENLATIGFKGVATSSEFIMIVGSGSTSAGSSIQMANDISSLVPDLGSDLSLKSQVSEDESAEAQEDELGLNLSATDQLDAWLRAAEFELNSEIPASSLQGSLMTKGMTTKAASVGSKQSFKVLSSLSSVSGHVAVEAEARCIGDEVTVYVDTRLSGNQVCFGDIQKLCNMYDDVAKREISLYGEPSDVNGDGRVVALLTPQINKLGAMGGGIITGYFYAGDLYAGSNEMEIVHLLVPDPDGTYGTPISEEAACDNLLPAVFPHELQHAISYNQHVFVKGGLPEENWLNEALSHGTEDWLGFGMENPSRYELFLANPSSTRVVTPGSPSLVERGAAFLFLRYLFEQSDDPHGFLKRLLDGGERGVANIEQAFNSTDENFDQFSEFFGRWTVAVAMSNRGISRDSRYTYDQRTQNSATGEWEGVCLICDADDGRGTTLEGVYMSAYRGYHSATISPSAAKYYDITTIPNQMVLEGKSGDGSFGILVRVK